MPSNNPIRDHSYAFALKIVNLSTILQNNREYVLSKQVLKSGTSIGANVEEGLQAQSRPDFISKFSIALKEAHETRYWLRLLGDANVVPDRLLEPLHQQIGEIIALLTSILRTTRSKKP